MSSISDKIKSIGATVGGAYKKPSQAHFEACKTLLLGNDTALDYLRITRGLTDETIKHFQLGYDSDKNAIMIPVFKRGELVNLRYRFLDKDASPKYIQTGGCEPWVYNEDGISDGMKKGSVLIVEGEFDLMSAWQAGVKNVISPSSGKDSYGLWLELVDNVPKVFIAYDNDVPGKDAAKKMSSRIGIEKCREILYPKGIKDANEYFKKYDLDNFRELWRNARPFYRYDFLGVPDIIDKLRQDKYEYITLESLPYVELENGIQVVLSGVANVGKTSYALNLAKELVDQDKPVLFIPFERGIEVAGKRYLQVKNDIEKHGFQKLNNKQWDELKSNSLNDQIYFSVPKKKELMEVLLKAKRIFDIKTVVIDHLDYLVRQSTGKAAEIGNLLQDLHLFGEEHGMIFIILHHLKKIEIGVNGKMRKPVMEDLKDSSALYQDPETVILLSSPEKNILEIDIAKNKGDMGSKHYKFNEKTGKLYGLTDEQKDVDAFDEI